MNSILKLFLALALSTYQSKVLSDIWNWFISPYFGIKGLELIPAMGISLFITVAHLKSNFKKEVDTLLFLEENPRQLQALAALNSLDGPSQKVIDMYLMSKDLLVVNSKRELTSLGREYVKEIRRRHFIGAKKPAMTTF